MLELTTIIGLVMGFGALLTAHIIEGGGSPLALLSLLSPSAALIVFGGTIGAVLIAFPLEEVKTLPQVLRQTFFKNTLQTAALVSKLVSFAEKARREGLLALETEVSQAGDPFLQKGIQLV